MHETDVPSAHRCCRPERFRGVARLTNDTPTLVPNAPSGHRCGRGHSDDTIPSSGGGHCHGLAAWGWTTSGLLRKSQNSDACRAEALGRSFPASPTEFDCSEQSAFSSSAPPVSTFVLGPMARPYNHVAHHASWLDSSGVRDFFSVLHLGMTT